MSILLFLILASLALALAALLGFVWAVKTGQFEDTCTPSMRLLTDDPAASHPSSSQIAAADVGRRTPTNSTPNSGSVRLLTSAATNRFKL